MNEEATCVTLSGKKVNKLCTANGGRGDGDVDGDGSVESPGWASGGAGAGVTSRRCYAV